MKKKLSIIAIVFIVSIILSSVALAGFSLNRKEWGLIDSNGRVEFYIEIPSVNKNGSIVEASSCMYFPEGYQCTMKHRGSQNEHYHFLLYHINYNFNSFGLKAYVIQDSLGNNIKSDYFEDDEITYRAIPKNTPFEKFCVTALKLAGLN